MVEKQPKQDAEQNRDANPMPSLSAYEQGFSVISLINGFLVGAGVGIVCLVLDFLMGFVLSAASGKHGFIFGLNTLLTSAALIGIAVAALKRSKDKGFVRGMLIALSLAFIASTTCGIALLRG